MRFNTALLHDGYGPEEKTGATMIPIYQSSSFAQKTAEDLEEIFNGNRYGHIYTRISNPTIEAFEKRITCLEGGIAAIACSSGMAAIALAIMNIAKCGDEIISGSGIFGGTYSLFNNFKDFGITAKYSSDNDISSFESCITKKTKLIFIETIGNPKLDVPDIKKLSALAHRHEIPLLVDNTVTTPYLVRPMELGADIVMHSTSKYINGSGNSIGGIIIDSGRFHWKFEKYPTLAEFKKYGPFMYVAKLRKGLFKDLGACISPFNSFLNNVGLETLGLRMEKTCENTLHLAEYLRTNKKVISINYPGLKENEYYNIAKSQFNGRFGGILTIRLGSKDNAFKLINNLKYAANLANIGDVRTIVTHPSSTIFAGNTIQEKELAGVYEDMIRISLGIENIEDLIEDFSQALNL